MKSIFSLLKFALIPLASIIGALTLFEGGLRIMLLVSTPKRWNDRPSFFYVHEGSRSLGDNTFTPEKPVNTYRVAVVGDSIAFGPKMQVDDTFAAKLERILNMNQNTTKAEVINLGVPGYSTRDEIPKVQRALEIQSDVIVLEICLNDPEETLVQDAGHLRFGAYQPSPPMKKISSYWKSVGFIAERLHNTRTRSEYQNYFFQLFEDEKTWNLFQNSSREILSLAKEKGIPVVPVIFPLFGFPLDEKYPFSSLHEKIRVMYEGMGVRTLDLFQVMKNIPPERLQVAPGIDLHPNEIAHRIAAEAIFTFLVRQKILPSDLFSLRQVYPTRENIYQERRKGAYPVSR